jgi:hypothetical protein
LPVTVIVGKRERVIRFSIFTYFCGGVWMTEELGEEVKKTVKTTLNLADELWRDVKVYAARKGLKLTEVVQAALKEYIEEEPRKEKK